MGNQTDRTFPFWRRPLSAVRAAAVFAVIAVIAGADAVADMQLGLPPWNIATDLVITTGALIAGGIYSWRWAVLRRHTSALSNRLTAARADADHWRAEAASVLPALGSAMRRQFERWGLTHDEQQVAVMLLNGLSSKEIAEARHGTVDAARQLTLSIYRKGGFGGRAALSAFFLQDLLFLAGPTPPARDVPVAPAVGQDVSRWN